MSDADLVALGDGVFDGWSARLEADGLEAPDRRLGGLDVRRMDITGAREDVAGYLAKGSFESVALEAAGEKQGRRGNRTPMQILRDVMDGGLARDWALWYEWEAGSKGRRAISWKRGFKASLGLLDGKTDEELANEGEPSVIVALVADDDMPALRRHPFAYASALLVVENSTPDDAYDRLCVWFQRWGRSPPLRPPA